MNLQLVLPIVLIVLTISFIAVVVYLVLVLHELRKTVKKTNFILDDVQKVADAVSDPVSIIAGMLSGFKSVNNFRQKRKERR